MTAVIIHFPRSSDPTTTYRNIQILYISDLSTLGWFRTKTFDFLQTSVIHLQNRINKSKKSRYVVKYLTEGIKSYWLKGVSKKMRISILRCLEASDQKIKEVWPPFKLNFTYWDMFSGRSEMILKGILDTCTESNTMYPLSKLLSKLPVILSAIQWYKLIVSSILYLKQSWKHVPVGKI